MVMMAVCGGRTPCDTAPGTGRQRVLTLEPNTHTHSVALTGRRYAFARLCRACGRAIRHHPPPPLHCVVQ